MTPDSSVARGAASLLASRMAVAAIALAFIGVSTRLLTLEQMAVFAVYNTFCGLLTVVCSLGLLASGLKHVPAWRAQGQPARAAALVRTAWWVYLAGALVVTLAAIAAAGPIARVLLKDEARAGDVRVAAAAALCFGLYEAVQLLLSSLQRFGRQARDNVAAALAQRLLSLGLFFPFGLPGYMAGFAAGSLLGMVSGGIALRRFVRSGGGAADLPGGPAGAVKEAFPFYLDGYLRYFYMHADQLLVGIFLTPADLSVYFVAKRFLQYGQVVVSSLIEPLVAKAAQVGADPVALGRTYELSLRWAVLVFVPLGTMLAAASPFLLHVIGGPRYAPGTLPLAMLMLSLPMFALFSQAGAFVHALRPPRERLMANLACSALQLAGMAALAPVWGLTGLAASRVVGFAGGSWAARRLLARHPGAGHPSGALRRAIGRALPATMIPAAATVAVHVIAGRPMLTGAAACLAAGVCALWMIRRGLEPADRAILAGMVPGTGEASRRLRGALAGPAGAPPI